MTGLASLAALLRSRLMPTDMFVWRMPVPTLFPSLSGQTKRDHPEANEEALVMATLRDMNMSKLVAQDVPLFLALLSDLFPNAGNPPGRSFPEIKAAIHDVCQQHKVRPGVARWMFFFFLFVDRTFSTSRGRLAPPMAPVCFWTALGAHFAHLPHLLHT